MIGLLRVRLTESMEGEEGLELLSRRGLGEGRQKGPPFGDEGTKVGGRDGSGLRWEGGVGVGGMGGRGEVGLGGGMARECGG